MARFQDYCMHVYAKALEKFAKDQSQVRHSLNVTISRQKSNKQTLKKIPQPNKLDIGHKEEELSCNPCLQTTFNNIKLINYLKQRRALSSWTHVLPCDWRRTQRVNSGCDICGVVSGCGGEEKRTVQ